MRALPEPPAEVGDHHRPNPDILRINERGCHSRCLRPEHSCMTGYAYPSLEFEKGLRGRTATGSAFDGQPAAIEVLETDTIVVPRELATLGGGSVTREIGVRVALGASHRRPGRSGRRDHRPGAVCAPRGVCARTPSQCLDPLVALRGE